MDGQSPLRRWKPFFAAFGLVDAAIEAAAGPALCRDELRSARGDVVELLCGVPAGAAGEELCAVLDGFMAESLLTLRAVPAEAVPRALASSAGLAEAVASLRRHQSARVSALARDVVRGWSAAVEADVARTSAAVRKLDDLCRAKASDASRPLSSKTKPRTEEKAKAAAAAAVPVSLPKTAPPSEEKMEATKRKHREGYWEVEEAKRQRKVKEIKPPKMLEQRQRKMHPILRERSKARCGNSTAVRRCLVSSFERV
ncbi:hypothetical protein PVAP13_9KG349083 [Panicum virgatum]|uniref:TFIIS N-terminal domain-containing protein n=1 Tax=Panicum virgatum TaxID=38727 RepID=A0A8T0NNC0_PANVG|nr:hypothetical protein PVAP13_9KG349083 [Panicum virgatum]